MQNAVIMSCQMSITGNSAPQWAIDETVTQCRPSSTSPLLLHVTNLSVFFMCECHERHILMGTDGLMTLLRVKYQSTVIDITYCRLLTLMIHS